MRLANIVPVIFRKARTDIKFKGKYIPTKYLTFLYKYPEDPIWVHLDLYENFMDVDYTIPSGWVVMVCPPAVRLDPIKYKEPLEFNPWRWEVINLYLFSKIFLKRMIWKVTCLTYNLPNCIEFRRWISKVHPSLSWLLEVAKGFVLGQILLDFKWLSFFIA